MQEIDRLDPKKHLLVKGAHEHNLKNIDVAIPRNSFTVITGMSGSGKSSLAFDTIYAEGQRRYVESLSSYARQFLGKLEKPKVEYIKGIAPAVAIEQKTISGNTRSTVGSSSEVFDYLRLLYAKIGKTFSPISGKEVKKDHVDHIEKAIINLEEGTKILICAKIKKKTDRTWRKQFEIYIQQGFQRIWIEDRISKIEDYLEQDLFDENIKHYFLLIDRLVVQKNDQDFLPRLSDSIRTALYEGDQELEIVELSNSAPKIHHFSNKFEADGIEFEEPSVNLFNYNNPIGACKTCDGFGYTIGIDPDKVIPDKSKSLYDGAIAPWEKSGMDYFKNQFIKNSTKNNFPIHKPIEALDPEMYNLLWEGDNLTEGLDGFFEYIKSKAYKIQNRILLSRYRGKTPCQDCKGSRLKKETFYVKVGTLSFPELADLHIDDALDYFKTLKLDEHDQKIADRILKEIVSRLEFMQNLGLGYLSLNRKSNTLSGGESQRLNLSVSLGSSLVGSIYILDEPSIGLHPRDTAKLIEVLKNLQKLGNTVIIVEHDEDIMKSADYIIDMGPEAGVNGGQVVFNGSFADLKTAKNSISAAYLTDARRIETPSRRRVSKDVLSLKGFSFRNFEQLNLDIPLRNFCVFTGVSGSGKSTLLIDGVFKELERLKEQPKKETYIANAFKAFKEIELIDQNPIGRSSRSNPATYTKAYDEIRKLFLKQPLSNARSFKASHFSFNTSGGRCETCQGEGFLRVDMQFMADVQLVCEDCKGKRFKDEVLDIQYLDHNIYDILNLNVEQAYQLFNQDPKNYKICDKLKPLVDLGLGYLSLGQSNNTLSGGEAQRLKLATYLQKGNKSENTLFIFDEPTTGLHFEDVQKLLVAFDALIKIGHSVWCIEHHPDLIKCADWIIDIGPEAGKNGGKVIFEGTPEDMVLSSSKMSKYLKEKL